MRKSLILIGLIRYAVVLSAHKLVYHEVSPVTWSALKGEITTTATALAEEYMHLQCRSALFYGPPGVGKTFLVYAFAHYLQLPVYVLDCAHALPIAQPHDFFQLLAELTTIPKQKALLLVDNLSFLISHDNTHGSLLIEHLCALKQNNPNIIICGTLRYRYPDHQMRDLFDRYIQIELPSFLARKRFIEDYTHEKNMNVDLSTIQQWAQETDDLSYGTIKQIIDRTLFRSTNSTSHIKSSFFSHCVRICTLFKRAEEQFHSQRKDDDAGRDPLQEIDPQNISAQCNGLRDFIGPIPPEVEHMVHAINSNAPNPPRGILLYGPPGTGKTSLARACAKDIKAHFFYSCGPHFINKYVGSGPAAVRKLFRQAYQATKLGPYAKAVIFIDEIDGICPTQNSPDNAEYFNTIKELMIQLDGFYNNTSLFVIAATNNYDLLDKALIRSGRFDHAVYMGLPDHVSRKKFIHLLQEKSNYPHNEFICSYAYDNLNGFSYADLHNFFKRITRSRFAHSITITKEHLDTVTSSMRKEFGIKNKR
jgi:transitional endoplasmic reticulum ATPase